MNTTPSYLETIGLTNEERGAIIAFHERFPLEDYRQLTFMMIDQNIAAASPSSVYRVLAGAGLLDRWNLKPSKKGTGFVQPLRAHEHWHIDVAYLTSAVRSTTSAPFSTAPAGPSFTGRSVRR